MCYNPITIKKSDGTYMKVKCGHCLECLREYQNSWSNRMYEELKSTGKGVFFTLTYNEESVPKNYLVDGKIYRSYTDYSYDNTYIKRVGKKGKKVIKSIIPGERIKEGVSAVKVLDDLGISHSNLIDFNLNNKDKSFIENVKDLYKHFIDITSSSIDTDKFDSDCGLSISDVEQWFENFQGDLFEDVKIDCERIINDENEEDIEETNCEQIADVISFNSVRKEDVINWLKRGLRKVKRNYGHGFKWFITSEYGPRTLRPHYHGVLFGVSREEAQCMFNDWNRHYGFSKIDNVDITKGGTSYCAKYCAKGFFEHPLCSKDFFYMKSGEQFTEYHSKHYERCIEWFGIDEPIVDKSFHLISKGLGIGYVDKMKDYFNRGFTDINFANSGTSSVVVIKDNFDAFIEYLNINEKKEKDKYREFIEKYRITSNNSKDYGKDFIVYIDNLFRKFKYSKVTSKGEVVTYNMPQYYRTKILSDGLRSALATYVQYFNDALYREKLRQISPYIEDREDVQAILNLEKQSQEEIRIRKNRVYQTFKKLYNKSKI